MGQALRQEKYSELISYLDILHSTSKGWITRAEINCGYKQWHYKYNDLLGQDFNKENVFMSLNTFYSTFRRLEYLKELKAQFIDLDTYKTGFTKEQILMNLEENYFNQSIPRPNFIVDSGRGLYLIWLLNSVPSKALPLWKAIEEYLYSLLKPFGADRQALDPTRVLRVPGSINSKSNTIVKVIDQYDYVYDLREIQKEFLPELEERKAKKKGRPSKTVFIHRERSLYYARIQDIIKLCELREYDLKGNRELVLFLYRYKNETLIELLNITEFEETHMSTIISKREYKRRNNEYNKNKYQEKLIAEGKVSEKDKISQRREKIKDLLREGLSQKEIYLSLNISKRTCINDVKFLKEQGLI